MSESNKLIKVPGTILWARYSFSSNRLKYCGPDANLDLFERTASKVNDKKLREILCEFEAAFPYIQFIASENRIKDPFDWRVVEAFWLGNELLNNISINKFYKHLKDRFSKRAKPLVFDLFAGKISAGSKPYHAFHVFEIYQRFGSWRGIDLGPVIETINNCKISWGRIIKIEKETLDIEYQPLILSKKLSFGTSEIKKIDYKFRDKSFLENPKVGDWVSFHWNWACDILSKRQLKNLRKLTLWHLKLANLTS